MNPTTDDSPPSTAFRPPSLLHLYWVLHALHLALAGIAVQLWRRDTSGHRSLSGVVWTLTPWLCLAAMFWIPGAYLELPSDPLAHYIRTIEWESISAVREHSTWSKFSYFLGYTIAVLGSPETSASNVSNLEVYYVACSLLLSWQYYRLGRATGLDGRFAFLFVVAHSLIFGNDLFSFHRYYGISTSLFSQLGAVAATRLAVEAVTCSSGNVAPPTPFRVTAAISRAGTLGLLLLFTGMNHPQGILIAGLGVTAAVSSTWPRWPLIARFGIVGAVILISILMVVWWPKSSALEQVYRQEGWLTSFYSFNLLPGSPSFDRTMAILGWVGAANIAAACLVFRRHPATAMLTLLPIAALLLPITAIPLADVLSRHNSDPANILTFHRLLFSIPPGLALIMLGNSWAKDACSRPRHPDIHASRATVPWRSVRLAFPSVIVGATLFLTLAPASTPAYNRFYHSIASIPNDLSVRPWLKMLDTLSGLQPARPGGTDEIAVGELLYAARSQQSVAPSYFRLTSYVSAANTPAPDIIAFLRLWPATFFVPLTGRELYSPLSQTGQLSKHWIRQRTMVNTMGGPEFERASIYLGYHPLDSFPARVYTHK